MRFADALLLRASEEVDLRRAAAEDDANLISWVGASSNVGRFRRALADKAAVADANRRATSAFSFGVLHPRATLNW